MGEKNSNNDDDDDDDDDELMMSSEYLLNQLRPSSSTETIIEIYSVVIKLSVPTDLLTLSAFIQSVAPIKQFMICSLNSSKNT